MQEMWQGDQFQTSFCFIEKALCEVKASGQQFSFNIYWWILFRTYNKNKLWKISEYWSRKVSGSNFSTTFGVRFFEKNLPRVIFYYLIKFRCLVVFTSWDIGQYVYYNYLFPSLFPSLFPVNFEINISFLIKPFFYTTLKVTTKDRIS